MPCLHLHPRRLKITAEDLECARSACLIETGHLHQAAVSRQLRENTVLRDSLFTADVRAARRATAHLFSGVFIRSVGKRFFFVFRKHWSDVYVPFLREDALF